MYMFLSCAEMTGLWGLVNNAGILYLLPIEWTPMDIFKRTADVNLWGMIDITKTFLPLVKKAQGRVVNFSSAAGKGYVSISGFSRNYQIYPIKPHQNYLIGPVEQRNSDISSPHMHKLEQFWVIFIWPWNDDVCTNQMQTNKVLNGWDRAVLLDQWNLKCMSFS